MRRTITIIASLCLLAGCGGAPDATDQAGPSADNAIASPAAPTNAGSPLPENSAPPIANLADDATEAPRPPDSPEAAAEVVRQYYAALDTGRFEDAARLRASDPKGVTASALAQDAKAYTRLEATVGAPGETEGAAGSLFIDIPVEIRGTASDGTTSRQTGTVSLRRVNDVPGSTAEQRRWHIFGITLDDETASRVPVGR